MRSPSHIRGIGVALTLSLVTAIFSSTLRPLLPASLLNELLIALPCSAYILYVLSESRCRTGTATLIAVGLVILAVVWSAAPSFSMFVSAHVVLIWLSRSFVYRSSRLLAAADLLLSAAALVLSVVAMQRTGSVFLATWSFFLLQVLAVGMSAPRLRRTASARNQEYGFERARQQAEGALQRLGCTHNHRAQPPN